MAARTVADKLLIRPGATVWISNPARAALLGPLPPGAAVAEAPGGVDVAVVVAPDAATARAIVEANEPALRGTSAFWVLYPKAGRADINRDTLWPILAESGFRPIAQVAVDETWSALRFRPLRPGEEPFAGR
jgi:hypothetical protein